MNTFNLRKDPTRWSVGIEGDPLLLFFFIPPWVRVRAPVEVPVEPRPGESYEPEPALISGRVTYGPQTIGGNAIHVHVRTYSRSFKY